jgi:signal transduction histidine kinase
LRVSETLHQRTLELDATNARLRDLSRRVLSILEAERQQVAQDLHDGLGQLLAGALITMNSLAAQQPELAPATASVEEVIREAVQEVRRISHGLRPAILDELGPEAAIRTMVGQMPTEWNERITFSTKGERRRLDDRVETALYRIAQEALTNITRHSNAAHVRLELAYGAGSVRLDVQDDGVGMDRNADGFGITSMRERAALVGGSFMLHAAPGRGVKLTFEAPTPTEEP